MTLPGVDPKKLQQLQETTKRISAKVTLKQSSLLIELDTDNDGSRAVIPNLLEQLATSLGQQLRAFFAIKGEIVRAK